MSTLSNSLIFFRYNPVQYVSWPLDKLIFARTWRKDPAVRKRPRRGPRKEQAAPKGLYPPSQLTKGPGIEDDGSYLTAGPKKPFFFFRKKRIFCFFLACDKREPQISWIYVLALADVLNMLVQCRAHPSPCIALVPT